MSGKKPVPVVDRRTQQAVEAFEKALKTLHKRDYEKAEEQLAALGQRDRTRAAGALDQPLPDDALEGRDLLADRRLGVAELFRGAAERAVLRDRLQGDQMAQLESQPIIRFHDRFDTIHDLC